MQFCSLLKTVTQEHVVWGASNPLTSFPPAGKQSHQTCLLIWNKTIGSKSKDKPYQWKHTPLSRAQHHILKEILPLLQWWFRRERKPCWDFTVWIPKMVSDWGLIAQNVSPCRNSPSTMQKGCELDVALSATAENSIWRRRSGGIHLVPVFTLLSLFLQLAGVCIHSPAGQTCIGMCVCPNRNAELVECVRAGRKDIDLSLWAHTVCPQGCGAMPTPIRTFTHHHSHEDRMKQHGKRKRKRLRRKGEENGSGRAPCTVVLNRLL